MDSGATGREVTDSLDGAVIIYQRSGGIAGMSERWVVYPDGRVLQPDGQIRHVPPEQVSTLLRKIESLGFFDMNDEYLPQNPCCDRFTHTLTVRRDNQRKHVTTLDATPGTPAALWEAIDAVTQLAGSDS